MPSPSLDHILQSYVHYLAHNQRYHIPHDCVAISVWFERNGAVGRKCLEPTLYNISDAISNIKNRKLPGLLDTSFRVESGVVILRIARSETVDGKTLVYSQNGNAIYMMREKLTDARIGDIMSGELYPPAHVTIPIVDEEIVNIHYTRYFLDRKQRIRERRAFGNDTVSFHVPGGFKDECCTLEKQILSNRDFKTNLYGESIDYVATLLNDVETHMANVVNEMSGGGGDSGSSSEGETSGDTDRLVHIIHTYCSQDFGDDQKYRNVFAFVGETDFLAIVNPNVASSVAAYFNRDKYIKGAHFFEEPTVAYPDPGDQFWSDLTDAYDTESERETESEDAPATVSTSVCQEEKQV